MKKEPIYIVNKDAKAVKIRLDLDKNTITLEAVPPGQLETKIKPTAKNGGKLKT